MLRAAALILAAAPLVFPAGPLDFARAELDEAIRERKLNPATFRVRTEYSMVLPDEGFQILPGLVRGGSLRGLVYGLLEAATQIRTRGQLLSVKGQAKLPLRGVRRAASQDDWDRTPEAWFEQFTELARLRFNRFHFVLDAEPLTPERIETLRAISDAARERAVELVIGLEDPTAEEVMRLLAECEAVRGVHVDAETAAYISGPVSEAGRYVVLETTRAVKTAVPVPLRVAVDEGEPTPACDAPCSTYTVFSDDSAPPPVPLAGAGFELLGKPSEAWMALGYAVVRAAQPVRRAPARKAPVRKK
ncbi:MAG: hypothetical protein KJZ84_14890 [Bryobacteraceae bacterium]|nr:hypothetical protein [Bryobacteraceae bacterium]